MTLIKRAGALFLIAGILSAQQVLEDPVMKARALRASAPSHEDDLPPVPRAILEPPPLPAPVSHVKDTPGYRATRKARKSKRKTTKTAKPTKAATPVKKKPVKKNP
jgi:hypothetical protein